MDNSHLVLLFLAGIGTLLPIYGILFIIFRIVESTIERYVPIQAYQRAYQRSNSGDVNAADIKLACKKLKELATTKKSYRCRKADLNSVIELGIPASEKIRQLLTKALPNQNDQETIKILTDYLQKVTEALHQNNLEGKKLRTVDKETHIENHRRFYIPCISLLLLEAISLLYLSPQIELLSANQLRVVCGYFVLATLVALFLFRRQAKLIPLYLCISFGVVFLLLYSYSSRFHDRDVTTQNDPNFDGSISCPTWFRADDNCSDPIVVIGNSTSDLKMKVIYNDKVFFLRKDDNGCGAVLGSEILVSPSAPVSFRLQVKNKDFFTSNTQMIKIRFATMPDQGKSIPLAELTCKIPVENTIWADSRGIVLGFVGVPASITFVQLIMFLFNGPIKKLLGMGN